MAERLDEDAEFDLMLRRRSGEPQVRALMPVLYRLFDGDGYCEDEDGFRWLVIDASRIVDFIEDGRSVMDAFTDSGRWDVTRDPEPVALIAEIERTLRSARIAPTEHIGGDDHR